MDRSASQTATYHAINLAPMEVIMRATMGAAKLRWELPHYSGTVDVQETVPSGAFSGGGRPQSAPADSV